jgi:uncharacterized SAM-binding protein YcdF (DUF218 family)
MDEQIKVKKPQKRRNCCGSIFKSTAGVFLFLIAVLFFGWLALRAIGAFIVVSEPLHNVGAIVVLSGGEPDRLQEAARLYSEGYSTKMIVTQTSDDPIDPETHQAIWKKQRVVDLGVPTDDVYITSKIVDSTYEEAVQVLQVMQAHGVTSAIVVTDPYHSRRTKVIFDTVFKGSGLQVSIHSVPGQWYKASTWFMSVQGWEITASEVAKLVGFLFGFR